MSAAIAIEVQRDTKCEKTRPMKFLEQLKLQALRRFQEESNLYDSVLDEHVSALEAVVAESEDGIALISGSNIRGHGSKIQYVNPAFTRMTGYTAEEIIGKPANIIQKISGNPGDFESSGRVGSDSVVRSSELECTTKSSTRFWAEVSLAPLKDHDDHISRWIFVLRDVTARRLSKDLDTQLQKVMKENERLALDLEKEKLLASNLTHNAFHDGLTGLRNRQYFLDRLTETLERSLTRSSYQGAVVYLDLDGFKAINDTLGHRGGDLVLTETSRRLELCCRTQDTVARLGGDEFAILIDDIAGEAGAVVVRRILESLTLPFQIGDDRVSVTPSLGYCTVQPSYTNPEDIVRDADTAMYRAKRQGGGCCVYFDESISEIVATAALKKQELIQAIQDGEFELYYQPLLDILTTPPKLWGVEALVRWRHPGRGLLLPSEFLSLAEKSGVAVPLGLLILRLACIQMKQWQSCVLNPDFMLSVNVSTAQVNDPNFFRDLVDILADTELDARCLQLELVEETFALNTKAVTETLENIRNLGIQVALDKFGTGCSSITFLEKYSVDTIKFDGSLIKRLVGNPKEKHLAQLIIEFARTLGIRVIAERVEDDEESDALRQSGCTLVQGNAFSPAVEEASITRLLDQGTRVLLADRSNGLRHRANKSTP